MYAGLPQQTRRSHSNRIEQFCARKNLTVEMSTENNFVGNQRELEEMRAELERLRMENERHRRDMERMRNDRMVAPQGDVGNLLYNALVQGFQTVSIDLKIPKFEDESRNPNEFIVTLNKYFVTKSIRNEHKLDIVYNALEGQAKFWFEANRDNFADYNAFSQSFLEEFYSVPIRVKIKSDWLAKRFDSSDGNLQTYFLKQVKEAQHFVPRMDAYELHYIVIQQMPIRVREALVTVDFTDIKKIQQALSQLDLTIVEKTNNNNKKYNEERNKNRTDNFNSKNFVKGRNLQTQSQKSHICNCKLMSGASLANINSTQSSCGSIMGSQVIESIQLPNMSLPPPMMPDQASQLHSFGENNHLN